MSKPQSMSESQSMSEPKSQTDNQYLNYHLRLARDLAHQAQQQFPFIADDCCEEDLAFINQLAALPGQHAEPDFLFDGQQLLCRIITTYPHITPLIHRDLLWFFGGDCLHYMPDEEITHYQALDDRRQEAEQNGTPFSYEDERAKIMGLH